jgi:hypothetical protein
MLFCWRAVGRLISSTLQPAAFRGLGFDEDANEPLDRLLGETADRIASLEIVLVELSQTNGSPGNAADANTLAIRVRTAARRALRPPPTDDKINEAFKRATRADRPAARVGE